ncbi:MAG: UDP-N-acetylmuramoyl-tripeptide--D-alanyl-D-alanine ligase [Lachnospiraceae bacterium]|nr:UDP-N-acetylmuramoyl-tripeptide--D-alanyl-D-alanine ligase [Lachnospiraceae bacterium]
MKNMTLQNIAIACQGQLVCKKGEEQTNITGAVLDSRKVEEGFLFFATKGEKVDGHSFIPQVADKKAACVVCEKAPENVEIPYILVEDSFVALKQIAAFYREHLTIPIVGITGSVGKTSTKEMISSVLSTRYNVLKTEGNFNNEVGLPLTILRIRDEHKVAVVEMGINHFGEMHRLSEIAKPDICVITNIGQCHLEFLGSREGILKAKSEIFDFMNPEGYVCINGDDDMLSTIKEVHGHKPVTYGMTMKNDVYVTSVTSNGILGSDASVYLNDETFDVNVPLPGEHMVMNALAAACVGDLLGLKQEEIAEGIANAKPVGGRSNLIVLKDRMVLDDCYNANPVSMKAAIDLLNLANTRKVAILGDMFELGEGQEAMHGEIGTYGVENGIDVLVCVGELSKNMYDAAIKAQNNSNSDVKVYYMKETQQVIDKVQYYLENGDNILVKASHGMGFAKVVEALQK